MLKVRVKRTQASIASCNFFFHTRRQKQKTAAAKLKLCDVTKLSFG